MYKVLRWGLAIGLSSVGIHVLPILTLLTTPSSAAAAPAKQSVPTLETRKTVSLRNVQAELTFKESALPYALGGFRPQESRLQITRQGKIVRSGRIIQANGQPLSGVETVAVVDRDGTDEPVVVVEVQAQPETYYLVYRYDPANQQYTVTERLRYNQISLPSTEQIVKTATADGLTAELSVNRQADGLKLPTLVLRQNDRIVLNQPITLAGEDFILGVDGPLITDLDGDRIPEVMVLLATRGAHCCSISKLFTRTTNQPTYTEQTHFWGNFPAAPQLTTLNKPGGWVLLSQDDRFSYAFGGYAGSVRPPQVWRLQKGSLEDVTREYPDLVRSHAQEIWQWVNQPDSPKGQILVAYLADKYLLGEGEQGWQQVRQAYQEADRAAYFVKLQNFLQAAGYMPNDVGDRLVHQVSLTENIFISGMAISPKGSTLATISADGTVQVWDGNIEPATPMYSLVKPADQRIDWVGISPDGKVLATQEFGGKVQRWDLKTGKLLQSLPAPANTGTWRSITFGNQGELLWVGDRNDTNNIEVWNLSNNQLLRRLKRNASLVTAVAISADRRLIATAESATNQITLWDMQTDRLVKTLPGHADSIFTLAFSNNGKILVSRSTDYSIKAWNVDNGALVSSLPDYSGAIALSPDGTLVASANQNRIRIWRIGAE